MVIEPITRQAAVITRRAAVIFSGPMRHSPNANFAFRVVIAVQSVPGGGARYRCNLRFYARKTNHVAQYRLSSAASFWPNERRSNGTRYGA
jgi:hypothetical protein